VRLGILVGVKDINIERVGGTTQTPRDWSSDFEQLAYVGGHRFSTKKYDSGSLTVGPGATVPTLSVSGIGIYLCNSHYSSGVGPDRATAYVKCDGVNIGADYGWIYGIGGAYWYGMGSVGWHINKVYVNTWNTAANVYEVWSMAFHVPFHFRTSGGGKLVNWDGTLSSTQRQRVGYLLFVASRRVLCKLPKFVDAMVLRGKSGIKRFPQYPIIVERLGYFEKVEEEHPYRDHLADLPNEWDDELTLPDGTKVKSASPKKAKTVLTLIVPEDWDVKRALGKIKVDKVLEEE